MNGDMNGDMNAAQPDPYTVLGVDPDADTAEIAAAYRSAVRACHPDTAHPDRDRLAAVIAAYRQLRDHEPQPLAEQRARSSHGHDIPVRVHRTAARAPDLRAGPVRHHPGHNDRYGG